MASDRLSKFISLIKAEGFDDAIIDAVTEVVREIYEVLPVPIPVKKEPTLYNQFYKSENARLKNETKLTGMQRREAISTAWKTQKSTWKPDGTLTTSDKKKKKLNGLNVFIRETVKLQKVSLPEAAAKWKDLSEEERVRWKAQAETETLTSST